MGSAGPRRGGSPPCDSGKAPAPGPRPELPSGSEAAAAAAGGGGAPPAATKSCVQSSKPCVEPSASHATMTACTGPRSIPAFLAATRTSSSSVYQWYAPPGPTRIARCTTPEPAAAEWDGRASAASWCSTLSARRCADAAVAGSRWAALRGFAPPRWLSEYVFMQPWVGWRLPVNPCPGATAPSGAVPRIRYVDTERHALNLPPRWTSNRRC